MTLDTSLLRTRNERNYWQHAAFWLVMLVLVTLNVSMAPGGGKMSPLLATRIAFQLLCFVAVVYLHLNVLIPRLFEKDRYISYALAFALTSLGTAFVLYEGNDLIREVLFGGGVPLGPQGHGPGSSGFGPMAGRGGPPEGFGQNANFRPPFAKLMMVRGIQLMIVTGMGILLHLANKYIRSRDSEKRTLEAELTALKAQLSPHFLFNSLNNIYALCLTKSDSAPDYTLKLSKITRYILHESNRETITLKQELEFISDFLSLERIRLRDRAKITFKVEGNPDGRTIPPLILLPFIENIFKHGVNPDPDRANVAIVVTIESDGTIDIQMSNPLLPKNGDTGDDEDGDTDSGIGLTNVRRRLELLCHDKYELEITEKPQNYTVKLRLLP